MAIVNTGVKVSEEHRQAALDKMRGVLDTPVIRVHGRFLDSDARIDFGDWLDKLAVMYGLPEPPRDKDGDPVHYGMSISGEFTRWGGDPNECPEQVVGPR